MNSILGFVVGLLQSAPSLLGFVQANPTLPQPVQDQAMQVVQHAVTQASDAVTSSVQTVNTNGLTFSADRKSGLAPLSVWFTASLLGGEKNDLQYAVDFGDSSSTIMSWDNGKGTPDAWVLSVYHIYAAPGSYTARLVQYPASCKQGLLCGDSPQKKIISSISVTVTASSNISPGLTRFPCEASHDLNTTKGDRGVCVYKGMLDYGDDDFGFSFWFPSGWTVTQSNQHLNSYDGGTVSKGLTVTDGVRSITIEEFSSPSRSITIPFNGMSEGGPSKFYFDVPNHSWMTTTLDYTGASGVPKFADVSKNTMGGLHMFYGFEGHSAVATIVPLSAQHFLVLHGSMGPGGDRGTPDYIDPDFLAKSIAATDPTVATPVSVGEQIKFVEAERDAYIHYLDDEMPREITCADSNTCPVVIRATGDTMLSIDVPSQYGKSVSLEYKALGFAQENLFSSNGTVTTKHGIVWKRYGYGDGGCSSQKFYRASENPPTTKFSISVCEGDKFVMPSDDVILQILDSLAKG